MATQEFQLQEASSNMRNICSKVDYPIDPLQNPKPLYDFRHFTPHLQDLQHPRFQCEQQRWDAEAKTLPSILAKLEQVFNPDLSISLECLIHQRLPMKRQNIWVRKSNTPLCRERMKKVWPRGNTWIPQVIRSLYSRWCKKSKGWQMSNWLKYILWNILKHCDIHTAYKFWSRVSCWGCRKPWHLWVSQHKHPSKPSPVEFFPCGGDESHMS